MKNAIITPTFIGHFKFIDTYLKSFAEKTLDNDAIDFIFVIEKEDAEQFDKITSLYNNKLHIKTIYFDDVLKHFHIKYTPDELLAKYGRFTYQTFKKMYSMLYAKYDRYLVLDSESILLYPTNFTKLFNDFFAKPFISGTQIDFQKRTNAEFNMLFDNINFLLKSNNNIWILEGFVWFYDIKILSDLFKTHGDLIDMADKLIFHNKNSLLPNYIKCGIFEICLYQNYIYNNLHKYNYTYQDIDKIMASVMPKDIKQTYLYNFYQRLNGTCGVLEHAVLFLNKRNLIPLINIFKKLRFNIIRCDTTTVDNYNLQKYFVEALHPNILAASQDHRFCKSKKAILKVLMRNSRSYNKLTKHFHILISPITALLKWLFRAILLPFDLLRFLIDFIRIIITICL